MVGVKITYEGKNDIKSIQDKFRTHLSDKEIQKTTAFALNTTASRVAGFVKKQIKQEYNIKNKYLSRITKTTKKARGTQSGLYAEISHLYMPIPTIAFGAKDVYPKGVNVEIKKGRTKNLPKMFIRTMKSGHIGVFARGRYVSGKFTPDSNRDAKITEIKSPSPFTMATNKNIENKLEGNIRKQMPARLVAMLENKLKKMSR